MIVVLMGVSGSGKTTVGLLLAEQLGCTFADGDSYHSAVNKKRMAEGHPLSDEERQPWLEDLNRLLAGWYRAGLGGVLACSALRESYRTTLRAGLPEQTLRFVLLEGSQGLIADRIADRHHEFMTPALLESQFAALEMPRDALVVGIEHTPEQIVEEILARFERGRTAMF